MTDHPGAGSPWSRFPEELTGLDGELLTGERIPRWAAEDFGHTVHAPPLAVLSPRSVRDVREVVAAAARRGIPVAARGGGHSVHGQAQAPGGIVIDMTPLGRVVRMSDTEVTVEGGALWRDVVAATLPHGRTPPVLTDYLGTSVGGTLSVGGIGGMSHRHGVQTDCVLSLDVVTGAGEEVRCSPDRNRDLFDAVRAGLSQCALVVRATLRLERAPARVRRYVLPYDGLAEYLADQHRLAHEGRFGYLEGQPTPQPDGTWHHLMEAVAHQPCDRAAWPPDDRDLLGDLAFRRGAEEIEELDYADFLDRMTPGEALLRETGEWFHPHPWLNLFVPGAAAHSVVSTTLAGLTRHELGNSGLVLLYPVPTARIRTPLLRLPDDDTMYLFALLRTAPGDDPAARDAMTAANREIYDRARAAGAVAYPVNTLRMSPEDWRAHFGPVWDRLARARRRYDPAGVLTPGQGLAY
ncbi:FAD-binding protein [Streptomyces pactum]|uniref:FAD-binding protein n=1 Tax=Streptomyces pactum TaxID=68249 RepID=A0ABS0NED5_9ACTN|nr:FAD-binding protein [Streptomyces pactum]MBH5333554.1 FAD-binding protein [Streptomyces pactum]